MLAAFLPPRADPLPVRARHAVCEGEALAVRQFAGVILIVHAAGEDGDAARLELRP